MLTVAAQEAGHVPALVDTPTRLVPDAALQLDPPGRVVGSASPPRVWTLFGVSLS